MGPHGGPQGRPRRDGPRSLIARPHSRLRARSIPRGVVGGRLRLCDFVNVMYSGRAVESATRQELFAHPRHRYTEGLLASIPRLDSPRGEPLRPIRGTPRDVISWSKACAFAPRCDHADQECVTPDLPLLVDGFGDHRIRCVHPAPLTGAEPDEPGGELR